MGLITNIRAQVQAHDATPQAAATGPRADQRQPQGRTTPVSDPQTRDAAQQVPAKPVAVDPALLAARDTTENADIATAKAARVAYIQASIAAGISPLPLP